MRLPADRTRTSAPSAVPDVVADSGDEADPKTACEMRQVLPDSAVEAELGLCQALSSWDPRNVPTQDIVDHLRAVKAATFANDRDAARVCLQRQHVLDQLKYEADHFATTPDRFRYKAAARWRLRCDHVCSTAKKR